MVDLQLPMQSVLITTKVASSLSTILHLCRDCQFYLRRKPEYPEKTTDLPQVTESKTLGAIGTDCTGSCKSKNHTVMSTVPEYILLAIL